MRGKLFFLSFFSLIASSGNYLLAQSPPQKQYTLWYDGPAPLLPITSFDSLNAKALVQATPFDPAWEAWSLPVGNGYLGASIFGRTETERVQLTENSMAARSLYGGVGLTGFAELFIDFGHTNPKNYSRSLNLNDAVSTVTYEQNGVTYGREYFASYPDKVLVIKLTASRGGKLSFTLRPRIPYKKPFGPASNNNGRRGTVFAQGDLITLSGKLEYLNLLFEGQFKVVPYGGTVKGDNDADGDNGKLTVSHADSALIVVAVGTNYNLEGRVFTENNNYKKLTDTLPPHRKVSGIIREASGKKYDQLLDRHVADYKHFFSRVNLDLGGVQSPLTTDSLLKNYKAGIIDPYLEELYFQYGRYLLICSSRPGTLPPNLQGIWSQYDITPWTGGYWHNINIQMNYWPVFTTNLTELFQSFADYNLAYRAAASKIATQYIKTYNPSKLAEDNGWTIGTGASAYTISGPGSHSGPGTGGLTTKLFWDYYDFTGDKKILEDFTYPALLGMAKFLSKVVIDTAGLLLTSPSYSPEQRWIVNKEYYKTTGSAFDQQMIVENHKDVLKASKLIGDNDPLLPLLEYQLPKLDPVQIGWSGQIKEYREEAYYGELVADPEHRHTSQLIGLYPGTLINSNTPAWLDAAKISLNRRGDKTTGWGMAFRLNLWARIKDGDKAYRLLQTLLQKGTGENLWDTHPPFQIDGNFGGTAGVAEMLLQSHEGFIHLLPALPQSWANGFFSGLLARGAFEVSAKWNNRQAKGFTIKSNSGGTCRLKYFNLQEAIVKNKNGDPVAVEKKPDFISFETTPGGVYFINFIPAYKKVADPLHLVISENNSQTITVRWEKSPEAVSYSFYTHVGNAPCYTLVQAGIKKDFFQCKKAFTDKHFIIKVTAVDKSGRESNGANIVVSLEQNSGAKN